MGARPVVGSYWEVVQAFEVDGHWYKNGMVVQVVASGPENAEDHMVVVRWGGPGESPGTVGVGAKPEDHMADGGLGWYLHNPNYFGRELQPCPPERVALWVLAQ